MVCVEKETRGGRSHVARAAVFFAQRGASAYVCMAKTAKNKNETRLSARASLLYDDTGAPTVGVITLIGVVDATECDDQGNEWTSPNSVEVYAEDVSLMKQYGAKSITVRINSKGGDVMEANGIVGVLKNCGLPTRAEIYGVCASAATFVAMNCNECYMADGSLFMVHEPTGCVGGTCEEMRTRLSLYERLRADMVQLYAEKTGKSEEEVVALLSPETWLNAQQATEMGFVTGVLGNVSVTPAGDNPAEGEPASDPAAQEEKQDEKPAETDPAAQEEEEEKRGLGARLMDAVTGKESPAAVKAKQEVSDLRAELVAAKAAADGAAALAAKLQADLTALRETEEQRVQQRAAELTASAVPASDTLPPAGVKPKSWNPDDVTEALEKGGISAAVEAALGI